MTSAVDWATTAAALTAALGSATGDDLAIGSVLLAKLEGLGATYDGVYGAGAASAKAAVQSAYTAALGAWTPASQATHEQADKAAIYCEALQLASQLADPTNAAPLVYKGKPLAIGSSVPWEYPDVPVANAYRTLAGNVATIRGTVDLGSGFDFSALAGTGLNITVTQDGSDFPAVVSIIGVSASSQLVVIIQGVSSNLRPYIDRNYLVISTTNVPLTSSVSITVTGGTAAPILGLTTSVAYEGVASKVTYGAAVSGAWGNDIQVTVSDASDGEAFHYAATFTLGGYSESIDNVDPRVPPSTQGFLLVGSVAQVGAAGRPENGTHAFGSGTGGSQANEQARLEAALVMPAAASQSFLLAQHLGRFEAAWLALPILAPWGYYAPIPSSGASVDAPISPYGSIDVYALEQMLVATIAQAAALILELDS